MSFESQLESILSLIGILYYIAVTDDTPIPLTVKLNKDPAGVPLINAYEHYRTLLALAENN